MVLYKIYREIFIVEMILTYYCISRMSGAVPCTFTWLKWSLVPPDFKECCIKYS